VAVFRASVRRLASAFISQFLPLSWRRFCPVRFLVRTLGVVRWVSSDGQWVVELVHLTATGNGRDGDWVRVSHRGFFRG
jgi:hypothetical protein